MTQSATMPPQRGGANEFDEDIAAAWDLWSEQIGRALLPRLQQTAEDHPNLTSALICTSDGFTLCALGIDDPQAARLAAMVSSLYSISAATGQALTPEGEAGAHMHQLSLHNGTNRTVVEAVDGLIIGEVLIWLSADDASLGLLIIETQEIARLVRDMLSADSS